MKNTDGFNSDKTFLNVVNLDFSPAELTPNNLKDLQTLLALLRFPLLALFFFKDFILNGFNFASFSVWLVDLKEVLDLLMPSEKPVQVYFVLHFLHFIIFHLYFLLDFQVYVQTSMNQF